MPHCGWKVWRQGGTRCAPSLPCSADPTLAVVLRPRFPIVAVDNQGLAVAVTSSEGPGAGPRSRARLPSVNAILDADRAGRPLIWLEAGNVDFPRAVFLDGERRRTLESIPSREDTDPLAGDGFEIGGELFCKDRREASEQGRKDDDSNALAHGFLLLRLSCAVERSPFSVSREVRGRKVKDRYEPRKSLS